jgi:hypothetical protein
LAGAVGALVAGVAVAYLNVSPGGSGIGSASTGSVSLAINAPATYACTFGALKPGDLTGAAGQTCSFSVAYTGSIQAYVSLTVAIQSNAGVGAGKQPLYDGTNTTGLTFKITDAGGKTYTVPTGTGTTGGACPAGFTCWTAANDLAATYTPGATLTFSNTNTATWTVTPLFQKGVGNAYEGGTAALTLTAQAVQGAPANPLPASCTTSTIGQPCAGTWS